MSETSERVPPQPYIDFLSLMQGSALNSIRFRVSPIGSKFLQCSLPGVPRQYRAANLPEQGTSCLVGRDKQRVTACMERIGTGEDFRSSGLIKQLGKDVALKTANIIVDYFQ